jgi:hypothetical protein
MAGAHGALQPGWAPASIPPSSLDHIAWLVGRPIDHGDTHLVPGPAMPVGSPQTSWVPRIGMAGSFV